MARQDETVEWMAGLCSGSALALLLSPRRGGGTGQEEEEEGMCGPSSSFSHPPLFPSLSLLPYSPLVFDLVMTFLPLHLPAYMRHYSLHLPYILELHTTTTHLTYFVPIYLHLHTFTCPLTCVTTYAPAGSYHYLPCLLLLSDPQPFPLFIPAPFPS